MAYAGRRAALRKLINWSPVFKWCIEWKWCGRVPAISALSHWCPVCHGNLPMKESSGVRASVLISLRPIAPFHHCLFCGMKKRTRTWTKMRTATATATTTTTTILQLALDLVSSIILARYLLLCELSRSFSLVVILSVLDDGRNIPLWWCRHPQRAGCKAVSEWGLDRIDLRCVQHL